MHVEREQRSAVRDDHALTASGRDDHPPPAGTREASSSTPAAGTDPDEPNLEAVAPDVGVGMARVAGEGGDDAGHRLAGRDRDQPQVVGKGSLAPHHEHDTLPDRGCRVAAPDLDPQLRVRGRGRGERSCGDEGGKRPHAPYYTARALRDPEQLRPGSDLLEGQAAARARTRSASASAGIGLPSR